MNLFKDEAILFSLAHNITLNSFLYEWILLDNEFDEASNWTKISSMPKNPNPLLIALMKEQVEAMSLICVCFKFSW